VAVAAVLVAAAALIAIPEYLGLFRWRPGGIAGGGTSRSPRLLIVGLDGADWGIIDPLLARGELPHLAGLIEAGSRARLRSAQPMLSPVLWTTIATGVRPETHGIVDFVAVSPATGEAIPVTSRLRRSPAFWNILSGAGISVGITAWWATYPAEQVNGFMISDRVGYQGSDESRPALAEGKTWPADIWNDVLIETVSPARLKDAELTGYLGPSFAPTNPQEASEAAAAEKELRGIVASARSYERIANRLRLRFHPQVEALYLQSTDTIAHLTMRWRPPLMSGTKPGLEARFGGALDQAYREADQALGEAVTGAGPGANVLVLSDHGFHSGADRPLSTDSRIGRGRAADWHRRWGILILSGPAIRKGAEIRDPSLLDIAPTIIALAGLAVPPSLEGRVLSEAFTTEFRDALGPGTAIPPSPRASHSPPDSTAGAAGPDAADAAERKAILDRLVALGYLSSDSLNARNNRGILALNRGHYAEAIAEFQAALQIRPGQSAPLINMARAQWLSGDATSARSSLDRALAEEPRSPEALNLYGNIEMSQGRLTAAEERFRGALAFEPDDVDLHNSLGLLFEAQQRWPDALEEYRRVVAVDPDYAGGYNNAGNMLRRMDGDAEAEGWYRRAMEADPSFSGSWNNLALLLQDRGDLDGAEPLYRKAIALAPRDPRLHNNLGSLLLARGKFDEALAEFQEAARIDPLYAEARNGQGAVYNRMGRTEEELASYREALRISPSYLDARYNLGMTLLRKPETAAVGEAELKKVLAADPRYRPALVGLAAAARVRGAPGEAARLEAAAAAIRSGR